MQNDIAGGRQTLVELQAVHSGSVLLIENFERASTLRSEFGGVVCEVLGDNVINRPFENFLFFEVRSCSFHNTTTLIIIEGDNAFRELFGFNFFSHRESG